MNFLLSFTFIVNVLAVTTNKTLETPTVNWNATYASKCMYCRRMDMNVGFLVSYSYCPLRNSCLEDAWNYVDRKCNEVNVKNGENITLIQSGWKLGSDYAVGFCNPSYIYNCIIENAA